MGLLRPLDLIGENLAVPVEHDPPRRPRAVERDLAQESPQIRLDLPWFELLALLRRVHFGVQPGTVVSERNETARVRLDVEPDRHIRVQWARQLEGPMLVRQEDMVECDIAQIAKRFAAHIRAELVSSLARARTALAIEFARRVDVANCGKDLQLAGEFLLRVGR
jgi:hypothetical protein